MTKQLAYGGYYSNKKTELQVYLTYAKRSPCKNKFSKYRGVQKSSNPKKPFRASVSFKGVKYFGGAFADELEAAKAYNKLALAIIGPHALLNEIADEQSN